MNDYLWNIARYEGLIAALRAAARTIIRGDSDNNVDESRMAFDMLRKSSAPPVMVDVGAHHGSSLRNFVRHKWHVHAFEPDSNNRAVLQSRYANYPNINIDRRAVSDTLAEAAPFFNSPESTGISGLSAFHESHRRSDDVPVTTLRNVIDESPSLQQGIGFLKIDTEGNDLMVLRGMPWDELSPTLILCEFEDNKTEPLGYRFHDLANFLLHRGYSIIVSEWNPVQRYGAKHTWRRFAVYPCELADPRAWGNLIATKDTNIFAQLKVYCDIP